MELKHWFNMKLKNLSWVMLLPLLFQACGSQERTTPQGLKYTVITEGEGEVVDKGEYLVLNMLYKDDNDSIWFNTEKRGIPINIQKKDSVWVGLEGSIQEVFYELKKGDSITFNVTVEDLFKKTWAAPIPSARIRPESIISFYIGVEDLLDEEGLMAWRNEMMQKQQIQMQKDSDLLVQKDKDTIEAYLKENNISAKETESGLRYVIIDEGQGAKPVAGQKVRVNYTGNVLGGGYFDTSNKSIAEEKGIYNAQREPYEPIEFALGQRAVIPGWDEGIALLSEGGKATLYIPSGLAYGPRARGENIPANSILIFDVELVEIVKD